MLLSQITYPWSTDKCTWQLKGLGTPFEKSACEILDGAGEGSNLKWLFWEPLLEIN